MLSNTSKSATEWCERQGTASPNAELVLGNTNYAIDASQETVQSACSVSGHRNANTIDTTALLSPTMGTAQETDAFRASFERTYKYAMESPPLSSTVVFAYRLNALALVGLIWYACEVVEGVSKGPPAAWTRWLSVAAVGGAVAVIALTYAVSYYYGHLPGFTDDDYRLSAAWDRPPATELATIGLALSLDLLPLLELARPAPARLARVIIACFTVHCCVEIKFYVAFALNRLVDLHAIDATPARWRGDTGSSSLDRARTAASSPSTRRTG